jgi:autoinducer 2-degrading protein
MIVQVVNLEVQADKLEIFLAEAMTNLKASRTEPGIVQFDLLQNKDEPTKFMLYEVYKTEEDLEAHRATLHFKRWLEKGVPTLIGPRQRFLYSLVE